MTEMENSQDEETSPAADESLEELSAAFEDGGSAEEDVFKTKSSRA